MTQRPKMMRAVAGAVFLSLLATSRPFAQTSDGGVASLKDLRGNVLVSRESGLASAVDLARVRVGTRVITTANAHVVVVYDDGCRVTLEENQRYEVEKDKPCEALMAMPQSILVAPVAVASAATTIVPVIFGGAAIAALLDQRNRQQVSPS